MTSTQTTHIDQNGLKTGQALTILLLIAGFVLNSPLLVGFVAIAQLAGSLNLPFAPYKLVYQHLIKRSGWVQPRPEPDAPQPHRFAMMVGALFNGAATLALVSGLSLIGWTLVGIVVVLANLNFWLNFCVGCWMYYRLNRLGVPGFQAAPTAKEK
jgi:hypothetical protein